MDFQKVLTRLKSYYLNNVKNFLNEMDNTIEAGITSQEKATLSVFMMEQLFLKAFSEIVRFSNSKVVHNWLFRKWEYSENVILSWKNATHIIGLHKVYSCRIKFLNKKVFNKFLAVSMLNKSCVTVAGRNKQDNLQDITKDELITRAVKVLVSWKAMCNISHHWSIN